MKAAVLTGPEQIEIKRISVPEMESGMIEIQVAAIEVCGSDVPMWKAKQAGASLLAMSKVNDSKIFQS